MINNIENDHPDTCTVTWEVSNRCNYSCWYCPEHLHSGTTGWPDLEKSLALFGTLSLKNKNVFVTIIGGEPTLWPKLTQFLERIPENISTEIVTNASRTISWWERTKPSLDRVVLAFHPNTANISHFVSVATLLHNDPNIDVFTMLLYDPAQEEKLKEVATQLKHLDIDYQYKPIYPNFGPDMLEYSADQQHLILEDFHISRKKRKKIFKPNNYITVDGKKTSIKYLLVNRMNTFNGFYCLVGSKRFHIAYDGTIYAGSCQAQKLGTIENPIFLDQPLICPKQSCQCFDDVKVKKWKPL